MSDLYVGRNEEQVSDLIVEALAGILPNIVPGRWYDTHHMLGGGATAGAAVGLNQLYLSPLIFAEPVPISEIGINITATGTALTARLILYTALANHLPGVPLFDAGLVDVTTLGEKVAPSVLTLPAGITYAGVIPGGTMSTMYTNCSNGIAPYGCSTPASVTHLGSLIKFASGGVPPNPFTNVFSHATNSFIRVGVKAA